MSAEADSNKLKGKETPELSTEQHYPEMDKINIPHEQEMSSPSPLVQQEPSFNSFCTENSKERASDSWVDPEKSGFQEKQLSLRNSADVCPDDDVAGFGDSKGHDREVFDSSLTGSVKIDSTEDHNMRNPDSRVYNGEFGNGKAYVDVVSEIPLNEKTETGKNILQSTEDCKKRGDFDTRVVYESDELGNCKLGCDSVSEIHVNEKKGTGSNLLDIKKQQLLSDLQSGSLFKHINNNKDSHNHGAVSAVPEKGFGKKPKKNGNGGIKDGSHGCPFKIEVIDDTAVIDPMRVPANGHLNRRKNVKESGDEKKQKRVRSRKGRGGSKVVEESMQSSGVLGTVMKNSGDGSKRVYSREKLEILRYANVPAQQKFWGRVYSHLSPVVAQEYSHLAENKHHKQTASSRIGPSRQQYGRGVNQMPGILGEVCDEEAVLEHEMMPDNNEAKYHNPLDHGYSQDVSHGDNRAISEEECLEDSDDSDEYFASIQKPAFVVEGEPNFDAGPPEDGLEYLRRVRWEAAQIPDVNVAKVDRGRFNKEQTAYMPQIPDIPKCPEHLTPLKEWENAFLADFSKIREALSSLEATSVEISGKLQQLCNVAENNNTKKVPEVATSLNFDNCEDEENCYEPHDSASLASSMDSLIANMRDYEITSSSNTSSPKASGSKTSSNDPRLSVVLGMDSVARVSMLKRRIASVENMSSLSRTDCLWLFALCAAVDTPLNADTSAALRSLLRKCASLRAGKAELDDEVIMLNILATISGRYFGQSDI